MNIAHDDELAEIKKPHLIHAKSTTNADCPLFSIQKAIFGFDRRRAALAKVIKAI